MATTGAAILIQRFGSALNLHLHGAHPCSPPLRGNLRLCKSAVLLICRYLAFMGMDVRVRESGQWRGRRKLTKKGDPEVRRLLFNAAMRCTRSRGLSRRGRARFFHFFALRR